MKFALKKYLYILNDISNMLLKKDRDEKDKKIHLLTTVLIIAVAILVISLFVNVYLVTGA